MQGNLAIDMNPASTFEDVDAYIDAAPQEAREKLSQIRAVFQKVAPQAREVVSYNMPYYRYHGQLGGFAAFKHHVSLYGSIPDELRWELSHHKTGRGSIQFPLDEPLPVSLVAWCVKSRKKSIEARMEVRTK